MTQHSEALIERAGQICSKREETITEEQMAEQGNTLCMLPKTRVKGIAVAAKKRVAALQECARAGTLDGGGRGHGGVDPPRIRPHDGVSDEAGLRRFTRRGVVLRKARAEADRRETREGAVGGTISGDLSRSFETWDARQACPHQMTTLEIRHMKQIASTAAIERAAQCIECTCEGCTRMIRSILNLRVLDGDGFAIGALRPPKWEGHHAGQ
jgi:hypothetical protein